MKTIEDEFNIGSMKILSCCKNYFYKFQNSQNNKNEFNCVHSINMVIMVVMDITANISRNTVQKHVDFVNETSNPFHTNFIPKVNMKPIHSKLMTTSESFHYYFSMFIS